MMRSRKSYGRYFEFPYCTEQNPSFHPKLSNSDGQLQHLSLRLCVCLGPHCLVVVKVPKAGQSIQFGVVIAGAYGSMQSSQKM